MTTINKYRVYCSTTSTYEYVWSETEPTTCPINTAHSIDTSKTVITDKRDPSLIEIKEEIVATGGHWTTRSIALTAIQNSTTSVSIVWPYYNISPLCMEYITSLDHVGDTFSVVVGKNTIIGVITANTTTSSTWTAQNYTVGNIVNHNSKPYTCILNTTSNQAVTNRTYWQPGYELTVNSTVTDNIAIGFFARLFNGVDADELQEVIFINKTAGKIYVVAEPTHSFTAYTTYVQQSVYVVKDLEIGPPGPNDLGSSKIGGSNVPPNVSVTIEYTNKSVTTDKRFVGRVEYLY